LASHTSRSSGSSITSGVRNGTASALNSAQNLASIPLAGGGLSRLATARLEGVGVPVAHLLKSVGLKTRFDSGLT
jgi:hypothetical protein